MPLLIAGLQRSGTTMAMRICNSHPDVELQSEFGVYMFVDQPYSDFARAIMEQWLRKRNARFTANAPLGRHLPSANMLGNLVFTCRLLRAIRQCSGRDLVDGECIDAGLQQLSRQTKVVGDKYPDYVYQIEQLAADARARLVCLIRDPRASYLSYQKAFHGWGGGRWSVELLEAGHYAWNWDQLMRRIESLKERPNVLVERYEDLVVDPADFVVRLAELVDVDADRFDHSFVHTSSVRKFAGGIDPEDERLILDVAGDRMQALGYL